MMVKRMVVALSMAALGVAGMAAQENATFTLKSGERLSGQLMDLGGVGFTISVGGQQRQIPTNEVAVIDFTGGGTTQADWDRLNNGQFAVLKDGQIVNGQLTDVGGSSPLRLTFRSNGADRDLQSSEVARIVLARPNDAGTGTGVGTGGANTSEGITVSAREQWTPTGITVRRGEPLSISASGEIKIGGPGNPSASPAGAGATNAGNPAPSAPTGALIARIGNGAPFLIGSQTQIQAPAAGQLFLGINDSYLQDNEGTFQVQVTRGLRRR
ncbi:MAG TPA: hypothetical protein VFJ02_13875 [Vicinamibacterales bacterium]|nr:hypothetical protein [Vicinamibacterales bacterium]